MREPFWQLETDLESSWNFFHDNVFISWIGKLTIPRSNWILLYMKICYISVPLNVFGFSLFCATINLVLKINCRSHIILWKDEKWNSVSRPHKLSTLSRIFQNHFILIWILKMDIANTQVILNISICKDLKSDIPKFLEIIMPRN